jgi:hypothetical protein
MFSLTTELTCRDRCNDETPREIKMRTPVKLSDLFGVYRHNQLDQIVFPIVL